MAHKKPSFSEEELEQILVRREERGFAAAAHLLATVPFWGVLFLFCLMLYFRQRSREVIFHIQQALGFATLLYVCFLIYLIIEVILKLFMKILELQEVDLSTYNTYLIISVFSIYSIICLVGMMSVFLNRSFLYPIVGKYFMEGYLRNNPTN